jgi:hypothetical protein
MSVFLLCREKYLTNSGVFGRVNALWYQMLSGPSFTLCERFTMIVSVPNPNIMVRKVNGGG